MNSQTNEQDINTVGISATKNRNTFSSTPTHASKMCRIGLTLALTVMMALLLVSPAVSQTEVCGSSCTGSGGWHASTTAAPAYALGGDYYLAWKGNPGSDIWFTSGEPWSWAMEKRVDVGVAETDAAPALTAWGANYVLAWKDPSATSLSWAESSGSAWVEQGAISGVETNVAPALTSDGSTVYLAYTTTSGGIEYITNNGSGWSTPVALPASYVTMLPPAVTAYNRKLYFALTTATNQIEVVSCAISSCSTSWTSLGPVVVGSNPATTNAAPALTAGASYTGGPYLAWIDLKGNIDYANGKGSPWFGFEFRKGDKSSFSPALAFDVVQDGCVVNYYLELAFTNTSNDIYTDSVRVGTQFVKGGC